MWPDGMWPAGMWQDGMFPYYGLVTVDNIVIKGLMVRLDNGDVVPVQITGVYTTS